jgi:hypothetical protein
MRLPTRRRNLVVWSSSGRAGDGYRCSVFIHLRRTGRIRRLTHISAVLMILGLLRLAHAVRPRWRLLLGGACTVAGFVLRSSSWGTILLPGLLLLSYCLLSRPVRTRTTSD